MKKLLVVLALFLALTLTLAACGGASDKLQEKAAEKVAEKLIEQAGDVQDVNIDLDNNSVSVTDDEGNNMAVEGGDKVDLKTFSAVGYEITLPKGVNGGEVTRFTDDQDKETGVTGSFTTDGALSRQELFQTLDKALTAQGLKFVNPLDPEVTEPDFSDPQPGMQFLYQDGRGVSFFFASYDDNQFILSGFEE